MTAKYVLSASHIGTFKACPERFHLRYILGLKPIEETESQRYGTNWHKILEIVNLVPGNKCPDCDLEKKQVIPNCPLCNGTGLVTVGGMDAVMAYLDAAYAHPPMSKTPEEAEVEKITLLYSLIGYNWYYTEQGDYEVVAQELNFTIPLKSPGSKRSLPNVVIQGRIDKILKEHTTGKLFVKEHKSTGSSVDPDSNYWKHLTLDTQTLLYPLAAKSYGYKDVGVLYDVWHRPGIQPCKLTQTDSKAFVETGDYCGQKFEITHDQGLDFSCPPTIIHEGIPNVLVNGLKPQIEPGKKEGTFAIKETPEMFGARLLQDITERPTFYFRTQPIPRTDADLERFEIELFNLYQTIRAMDKNNTWWCNEHQCEATFKCPFLDICYNHVKIDPMNPPQGFDSRLKREQENKNVKKETD
jgi:hypothetical protein